MTTDRSGNNDPAELRNFNEEELFAGISGALALRPKIEQIVDEIWNSGFDGIYFTGIGGTYASAMQAEVYMRGRSGLPVYAENAAEFITTGRKRFTSRSIVICSSVSGTTKEMLAMAEKAHTLGARIFAFVDTPATPLAETADWVISYPQNEQLKFYMTCSYLMYLNHEFDDYSEYCRQMEQYLAEGLVNVEKESDAWARAYAEKTAADLRQNPDMPHYFIASGNQYGAAYSCAMCYWAEQLWIKSICVSAQEFFHGMLEIITGNVPVTLFVGEDEQRPLAERVARFLPRVSENYVIIDTRDYAMTGIDEKYRGTVSHLIMRSVMNRVDAWLEYELDHSRSIRRYYRRFDY